MPNTASASKRLRQTEVRTRRNKALRTSLRTWRKRILEAVEAGEKAAAESMLPQAYQALDKAARHRVIHPNTAANYKRKLARKVSALA